MKNYRSPNHARNVIGTNGDPPQTPSSKPPQRIRDFIAASQPQLRDRLFSSIDPETLKNAPDLICNRLLSLEHAGFVPLTLDVVDHFDLYLCGCVSISSGGKLLPVILALLADPLSRAPQFRGLNQIGLTTYILEIAQDVIRRTENEIERLRGDLLCFFEKMPQKVNRKKRSNSESELNPAHDPAPPSYN